MNCHICRSLLASYLVGDLDSLASVRVARHLAQGCAQCEDELARLSAASENWYQDLDPDAEVAPLWDRIEAKIVTEPSCSSCEQPQVIKINESHAAPTLAANGTRVAVAAALSIACGFLLATVGFYLVSNSATQSSPSIVAGGDTNGARAGNSFGSDIESGNDFKRDRDGLTWVALHQPQQPTRAVGSLVVDTAAWQVQVQLHSPPLSDTDPPYELWFVTSDQSRLFGGVLPQITQAHYGAVIDLPAPSQRVLHVVITGGPTPDATPLDSDIAFMSDTLPSSRGL